MTHLFIETEKVEIKGEENLAVYKNTKTKSGTPAFCYFCKTCGNPIKSVTPLYEGNTILKLGIFERIPQPESESFVEKRQKWLPALEGATQFKTNLGGEKMNA
ncbi:MAG: hypothetical protein M1834_009494 [Cirrosporium novae-zelandiae]|nr:MAG: hypothetical protein M1834_009494 [Cirrosporium novae-zelandiae]